MQAEALSLDSEVAESGPRNQHPPSREDTLASRLAVVGRLPIVLGRDRAPLLAGQAPLNVVIEIYDDLAAVAAEWQAFEQHADCTPFQKLVWLERWQRYIGVLKNSLPIIVVGRQHDGDILFILPLAIEDRGALRFLTWLGADLGDYNAPLLSSSFSSHPLANDFAPAWNEVARLIQSISSFRFDLADLPKMPEMVGGQSNPMLQLKVLPNRSGAYMATLGQSWDDYYSSTRSSSTRKTARRKQKQLETHGELRFVQPLDHNDAAKTLRVLIEQKSEAFARMGVENIFKRPGYPEFFHAIVTDPEVGDLVNVSRLDVGALFGSTNVSLQFRDRFYMILSSYHGGEISRFGPGTAHLHEMMRDAIERGFRLFDFTIGDEPYKLDWADIKLVLYDHLAAYTLRGRIAVSFSALLRRVARFIKQTPILWRLAVKIRALMARRKSAPAVSEDGVGSAAS